MSSVKYLQGWIGIVAVTAFGNTVSCFLGHEFLSERLYTAAPSEVNGLMGRLFGTWTLLSAVLRLYCAVFITNKGLYHMTMVSFIIAFGHFVSEGVLYKSVRLTEMGVVLPLVISSISFLWMSIAYKGIFKEAKPSDAEPTINMDEVRMGRRYIQKYQ